MPGFLLSGCDAFHFVLSDFHSCFGSWGKFGGGCFYLLSIVLGSARYEGLKV